MKEFDFIKKFLHSQSNTSLLVGIGDDAAVIAENQTSHRLLVKSASCQLNIHSDDSIRQSIQSLKALLESTEIQQGYLFLNLSLIAMNDKRMQLYISELNKILTQHKTILAGGDTTQGCGTVVYQLIGYKLE